MRKNVSFILAIAMICFSLTGCKNVSKKSTMNSGMQELYNRSAVAKEYADKRFYERLDSFYSNCEIKETSFGFYTSETPVYVVGYKYSNGVDDHLIYAYKISVNDEKICSVLEEGEDTAAFLFEN